MNSLTLVLRSAVAYYATHPQICCNARVLLDVCRSANRICQPITPEQCELVGIMAAREVAWPTKQVRVILTKLD